ncbi:MAG: hypothetical protein M1489_00880 [Firmicutes bacterium]|nr:hypothetical protein [Bacillota bacterium]
MPPKNAFSWSSLWFRLNYGFEENEGIKMIVAKSGAKIDWYDPLEHQQLPKRPRKPEEQDKSSPHTALARLDLKDTNAVLNFANKWGLLGLWNVPAYQMAEVLPENDVEVNLWKEKYSSWYIHPHKMRYHGWQEPVPVFIEAAKEYQNIIEEIKNLPPIGHEDRESQALILELRLNEKFKGIRPGVYLGENENWVAGWQYRSLLDAIYLLTFMSLVGNKYWRRCTKKRCNRLFITENPDNQYCSDRCRNAHLVQKHNEKIWKENLLKIYTEVDQKWLIDTIETLLGQGISGEKKLSKKIDSILKSLREV